MTDEERARNLVGPCLMPRVRRCGPGSECQPCHTAALIVAAIRAVRAPLEERLRYLTEEAHPADRKMWEHGVKRAEEARDRVQEQLATAQAEIARLTQLDEQFFAESPLRELREQLATERATTARLTEDRDQWKQRALGDDERYEADLKIAKADLTAAQATAAGLNAALVGAEMALRGLKYEPDQKRQLLANIEQALTDSAEVASTYREKVRAEMKEEAAKVAEDAAAFSSRPGDLHLSSQIAAEIRKLP